MRGIYLCCGRARHFNYDIVYQDIDHRFGNLVCDALEVDLSPFDFIIATPPCNWWSRANPYYKRSQYALSTKHLLPDLLTKLAHTKKPFILENVINKKRMTSEGVFDLSDYLGLYYQFVGRHTYWTNIPIDLTCPQHKDFRYGGRRINSDGHNQGGSNVHVVVEKWLEVLHALF